MKKINVQKMVLTALFVALMAVGAYIQIPTPTGVPFTLQILFVFLSGVLLGPGWGTLVPFIYVLLGLTGLPVFSGGGGFSYVLKPSFGFLLGYIAGAAVTGLLTRKDKSLLRIILACAAGLAAIYAIGLPYMGIILNVHLEKNMSLAAIVKSGMLIYLPWDALKIAATAILSKTLLPALRAAGWQR